MAAPLIAVWSPKGGVGKTLVATGLAMQLLRRCAGGTLLVDLDAGKADIAPLLKVALRPSILDYLDSGGRTVVHPTGLAILPGTPRLVEEGLVTAELAEAVLGQAAVHFGAIVADLDADLRDSTVVALERAAAILLVTTPDLLSVYACRRFVQEAAAVGLGMERVRLVVNRARPDQTIPDSEIISLTGVQPIGRVPDLPGLAAAINRGMISVTLRSNTDFALAMAQVAQRLAFAGISGGPAAPAAPPPPGGAVGLLPALKRWWQSL